MSPGPWANRARPFLIGHARFLIGHARFPTSAPITDKVAPQYMGAHPFSAAEPGRNRG